MNDPAAPRARRSAPVAETIVPLRVLCVDDHALLVEGLRAQFALDGRLQLVGSLTTADDLLNQVETHRPDVVLLDIEMPGADAFEAADRLHHEHPDVPFAFLSAHIRDGYLTASFKCGAGGYFSKADDLEDLVEATLQVARSHSDAFVMSPKVRQRCLGAAATTTPGGARPVPLLDCLTPREIEVLRLIGKGLSRVEIAAQLSRSPKTIDGHQERMLRKLNMESRADLMRFAIREGLAEA